MAVLQKKYSHFLRVGPTGFEPIMTEPKPVVLPLHHGPILKICGCKGTDFSLYFQIFILFFLYKT